MEKKRILSLLLLVAMLTTLVLPIGAFAEEEVQEPVYEETVDEAVYEETAYEEPVYEEFVDEEPTYEDPAVEADAVEEVIIEEAVEEETNILEDEEVFAAATLAITKQPEDVTAAAGTTAEIAIETNGTDVTYEWWFKNANKTTFSKSGATGNPYSVTMTTAMDGRQVYCVVKNAAGESVKSETVTMHLASDIVLNEVTYKKLTDTTLYVYAYAGTAATLEIPETVNGMTVVEIGEEAFMNNTTLTSIDLPDTITVIRARAFKGCTSLSSMS